MDKPTDVAQGNTPITPHHKDNNDNANTTESLLPATQSQNPTASKQNIETRQTVAVPSDLPLPTNKTSFLQWLDNSK